MNRRIKHRLLFVRIIVQVFDVIDLLNHREN